jgi:hypothetical protein
LPLLRVFGDSYLPLLRVFRGSYLPLLRHMSVLKRKYGALKNLK